MHTNVYNSAAEPPVTTNSAIDLRYDSEIFVWRRVALVDARVLFSGNV